MAHCVVGPRRVARDLGSGGRTPAKCPWVRASACATGCGCSRKHGCAAPWPAPSPCRPGFSPRRVPADGPACLRGARAGCDTRLRGYGRAAAHPGGVVPRSRSCPDRPRSRQGLNGSAVYVASALSGALSGGVLSGGVLAVAGARTLASAAAIIGLLAVTVGAAVRPGIPRAVRSGAGERARTEGAGVPGGTSLPDPPRKNDCCMRQRNHDSRHDSRDEKGF